MFIKFGNLTVEQFEKAVETEFTHEERTTLEEYRTNTAGFTDPTKFHIFDDPAISINIGSEAYKVCVPIFAQANARKNFNREVTFYPNSQEEREAIKEYQSTAPRPVSGDFIE